MDFDVYWLLLGLTAVHKLSDLPQVLEILALRDKLLNFDLLY
jgi:hypothetical protein